MAADRIPEGFQQTEVGVIPGDWEVKNIGNLTEKIGSGITPTGGSRVYKSEGRVFLRSQNVGWGSLLLDEVAFIDEETHKSFDATEIKEGDVLLNITGASIGRCAVADQQVKSGNVNQHVCIIRGIAGKLNPKYLSSIILSSIGQNQIDSFQAGGNRQGLNFGQIKAIQIPLPPTLAEQTAIAAALSDMDALIERLERLIGKKRAVKQGAMQELLTGKKRLAGFGGGKGMRRTEVGVVPEDWGVVNIGSLTEKIGSGITPTGGSRVYKKEGRVFLRSQNVGWGTLLLDEVVFIDEEAHKSFDSTEIRQGDVLLNITGASIGRCAVANGAVEHGNVNQHVCIIRAIEDKLNPEFLSAVILSRIGQDQIDSFQAGGNRQGLNFGQIKAMQIPLPPNLAEQRAIARALSDMDAEIGQLEAQLAKYRRMKEGMMQELLTGKKRLV